MAAGYDENVLENPFFKALTGKYRQIYEDASAKRLTVCLNSLRNSYVVIT